MKKSIYLILVIFLFPMLLNAEIEIVNTIHIQNYSNCTGEVFFLAIGDAGPFSVELCNSNGVTIDNIQSLEGTRSFDNLCPDKYTLKITDSFGCTKILDSEIFQCAFLLERHCAVLVHPTTCISDDGSITIPKECLYGATYPLKFIWAHDGDIFINKGNKLEDLKEGYYDVTIIDGNGCLIKHYFNLKPPTSPMVSVSGTEGCNTPTLTANGVGPFNFVWSDQPLLAWVNAYTNTRGPLSSGHYQVTVWNVNEPMDGPCTQILNLYYEDDYDPMQVEFRDAMGTCPTSPTASIEVRVLGGVPPYKCQFKDDNANCDSEVETVIYTSDWEAIEGLCTGDLKFTVQDECGKIVNESNFPVSIELEQGPFEYEVNVLHNLNYYNFGGSAYLQIISSHFEIGGNIRIDKADRDWDIEYDPSVHFSVQTISIKAPDNPSDPEHYTFVYTSPDGCVLEGEFEIPVCKEADLEKDFIFDVLHIEGLDEGEDCGPGQQHKYRVDVDNSSEMKNPPYFIEVYTERPIHNSENNYRQIVEYTGQDPFYIYGVPSGRIAFQASNKCNSYISSRVIHNNCCLEFDCRLLGESRFSSGGNGGYTFNFPFFDLIQFKQCYDNCGWIGQPNAACSNVTVVKEDIFTNHVNCWEGTITIKSPDGTFRTLRRRFSEGLDRFFTSDITPSSDDEAWEPDGPGSFEFTIIYDGDEGSDDCTLTQDVIFSDKDDPEFATINIKSKQISQANSSEFSPAYFRAETCAQCDNWGANYWFDHTGTCEGGPRGDFTYKPANWNIDNGSAGIGIHPDIWNEGGDITFVDFDASGKPIMKTVHIAANKAADGWQEYEWADTTGDGEDDTFYPVGGCWFDAKLVYGESFDKYIYVEFSGRTSQEPSVNPCGPNESWNVDLNDCVPNCSPDLECPDPDQSCVDGQCLELDECDDDCDCPMGFECWFGDCEPLEDPNGCSLYDDCQCPLGMQCVDGTCIENEINGNSSGVECNGINKFCPDGQWCRAYHCEDCPDIDVTYCWSTPSCGNHQDCYLEINIQGESPYGFADIKIVGSNGNISSYSGRSIGDFVQQFSIQVPKCGVEYTVHVDFETCPRISTVLLYEGATANFYCGIGNSEPCDPFTGGNSTSFITNDTPELTELRSDDSDDEISINGIEYSVEGLSKAPKYKIYPNPFSNWINVDHTADQDGTLDIVITDIYGQLIQKEKRNIIKGVNKHQLEIQADVPEGIYYISISKGKAEPAIYKLLRL